jgi:hypothetical protein
MVCYIFSSSSSDQFLILGARYSSSVETKRRVSSVDLTFITPGRKLGSVEELSSPIRLQLPSEQQFSTWKYFSSKGEYLENTELLELFTSSNTLTWKNLQQILSSKYDFPSSVSSIQPQLFLQYVSRKGNLKLSSSFLTETNYYHAIYDKYNKLERNNDGVLQIRIFIRCSSFTTTGIVQRDEVQAETLIKENVDVRVDLNHHCAICFDDFPISALCHPIGCSNPETHLFCYFCLTRSILFQVKGSNDTVANQIPTCPLAKEKKDGCGSELTEEEVVEILSLYYHSTTKGKKSLFWSVLASSEPRLFQNKNEVEEIIEKIQSLYLVRHLDFPFSFSSYFSCQNKAVQDCSCIPCPKCSDNKIVHWMQVPEQYPTKDSLMIENAGVMKIAEPLKRMFKDLKGGNKITENKTIKLECPHCSSSFCSSCLASPFHYHGKCQEIEGLTKAWYEWKNGKQEEYLKELSKVSGHEGMYEEYQMNLCGKEMLLAGQKLQEIKDNEKEMARACKTCPHCGAPSVKVSVFDMVRL